MFDISTLARELEGRYRIDGLLGQGGMGAVVRARHLALERDVAIKVLAPSGNDPHAAERMLREARIAAHIESPHVVKCFDFGVLGDGSPYMVLEFVAGPSLRDKIDEGPLPIADLARYMQHAAIGMAAAAEIGVLHRDLKPANMLIEPTGELKIADFGLARMSAGSSGPASSSNRPLTAAGMVLGTPYYMAPEQAFTPRDSDTRADIYGYGASFYHAATGRKPFEHKDMLDLLLAHQNEIPTRPSVHRPDLPDHLQSILERCLAKEPKHRFGSFEEIVSALEGAHSGRWGGPFDVTLAAHADQYRKVRASLLAGGPPGTAAVFSFHHGRTLSIVRGDIAKARADAIVSSDDGQLTMSGGVARALNMGSGGVCHAETRKFVPVRHGGVVVSSAGHLEARFVFHAVTLDWDRTATYRPTRDLIARLVDGCLYHAETLRLTSLVLPLLGTGRAGFSAAECLDVMVEFFVKALLRGATSLSHVTLVLLPTTAG